MDAHGIPVRVLVTQGTAAGCGIVTHDRYGSCPLTVEQGKIVLVQSGYGSRLLPGFPKYFIDGQRPSRVT